MGNYFVSLGYSSFCGLSIEADTAEEALEKAQKQAEDAFDDDMENDILTHLDRWPEADHAELTE